MSNPNSNSVLLTKYTNLISLEELQTVSTPPETATHKPIPHHQFVEVVLEALAFRHITCSRSQFAMSPDGMKCFGVLDLSMGFEGCKFSIGLRNSNDKSLRLGLTVGVRVMVCDNLAFQGDFTPILAKHSKNLELLDLVAVGVDKMQRNFQPMQNNVLALQRKEISDQEAKLIMYEAFVNGRLKLPLNLLPDVDKEYFEPRHEDFKPRTLWSLSNAFTEIFKLLKPMNQLKAATQVSPFIEQYL